MEKFFATTPKGLEELLAQELTQLGAVEIRQTIAGVSFAATWPIAYRALLWSRLASRIFFPLKSFTTTSQDDLYEGLKTIPWDEHMSLQTRFMVDAHVSDAALSHSRFVAQRSKDAIVDYFRERTGRRPDVDRESPDLRIGVHLRGERAQVSIDLAGLALSHRGYRRDAGEAPLRENLAAAILLRAGWPEIAAEGGALVDPMCGSGTFLVEGLLMAADIAPGSLRERFGIQGWSRYDAALWAEARAEACERATLGIERIRELKLAFAGFDHDKNAIEAARANAERAGNAGFFQWGTRALGLWKPANARGWRPGLVVVNPPYGERLGDAAELPDLYAELGRVLTQSFSGWRAAVFTGNPQLGKRMGLRAEKRYKLFNGALPCELLRFKVEEEYLVKHGGLPMAAGGRSEGASAFRNRLKKNLTGLAKWVAAEKIEAYRIYDADMPEYNVAIDRYGDVVVVSEYAPPADVEPEKAEQRLADVLMVLPEALSVPRDRIALKQRRRRKGEDRYDKLERRNEFVEVRENGLRFLINPFDYLDVGLFNDHRPIRARIRALAEGKRFLNLFAYTGSATVAAIAGGARLTRTVDLSQTYLEWAERNLELNGFRLGSAHSFDRDDCQAWLEHARGSYDLIFLDPPTFSNSKSFEGNFEVQRDHVQLILATARLLAPDGLLLFSNNFRRFRIDAEALVDHGLAVVDITTATIPQDFARNSRIHSCFEIRKRRR